MPIYDKGMYFLGCWKSCKKKWCEYII